MSTSRRPAKPGQGPEGNPSEGWDAPVELGNAPVDGWITIEVPHLAAPQGSHRQGFGKSVQETNPKTEPYRHAVAEACERWCDQHFLGEPLLLDGHLEAEFVFRMRPAPKSDPDRPSPNVAPDLDKLVRSTFDGLTRGKLWKDDARCVKVTAEKIHAVSEEGTGVTIRVRMRSGGSPGPA